MRNELTAMITQLGRTPNPAPRVSDLCAQAVLPFAFDPAP
jgi:hypothetical protein